jgi:hypothetical protein
MSSQAVVDADHRDSQKSTGSRFNAVTHGLTAKTPVLPNEDAEAYLAKIEAFKASLQTRNEHENELAARAAQAAWQLDRATRSEVARITLKMHTEAVEAEFREAKKVASLGNRLFHDRRGPVDFYPSHNYIDGEPRTSWSEDADDPAMLVMELETTLAGCRWLRCRWEELRSLLVESSGGGFQSHEKFKAIRLMGREPVNAISAREVAQVFLACHVIEPQYKYAFQEIRCEIHDDRFKRYKARLSRRNLEAITPADATAARAVLLGIVDTAIERLRTLEAQRQEVADIADGLQAAILSVDESKSGDKIYRLKASSNRLLLQNLDAINKGRRAEASDWGRTREERGRRKEERGQRNKGGRLLMTDENGTTRYVDDYEREKELKARLAEACGAVGWVGDEERLKAEGGRMSQRIASEADFGDGAADVAQDEAVPVMLTETGERANLQNEMDGSSRTTEAEEGRRASEEGAEETFGRADGGVRDPRRAEVVPLMLTETGEQTKIQNELVGSGRRTEGGEGGGAIEEGAEERLKAECGRMNQRLGPAADAIVTGAGHGERSEMVTTDVGGGDRPEGGHVGETADRTRRPELFDELSVDNRRNLLASIGFLEELLE